MLFLVCFLLLIAASHTKEASVGPVRHLDYDKLLGRYYYVYLNQEYFDAKFKNYYCASVEFTEVNDTTLAFKTSRRKDSIDGDFEYFDGLMFKTKVGGKFDMVVNWDPDRTIELWLVRLGPTKCGDELYSYFISTVATASGRSYVVYARDVKELKTEYDNVVKKWLKAKDYSDPVPAEQPEECVYEEDAKK